MVKYIKGHKFYYRLVKPSKYESEENRVGNKEYLYKYYSNSELYGKLVVQYSIYNSYSKNKLNRLFGLFDNYMEFAIFMLKFDERDRNFYETIGPGYQKPKFDIEIEHFDVNIQEVIDEVINGILIVMKENGVDLVMERDILLYTSHGSKKQSCHIVVDNWCHTDNIQAEAFYNKVVGKVQNLLLVKYIDKSVYSKLQQFRIVGNQKNGSDRPKVLNETWKYRNYEYKHIYVDEPEDDKHKFVLQLGESLITNTQYCKILPNFTKIQKDEFGIINRSKGIFDNISYESSEITKDMAIKAITMLAGMVNVSPRDPRFPYKFKSVNNGFIVLTRLKPSRCKICNRIHHNENPYLYISGEEQSVYFSCRRNEEDKKMFVGKLNPYGENENGKEGGEEENQDDRSSVDSFKRNQKEKATPELMASKTLPKYENKKKNMTEKHEENLKNYKIRQSFVSKFIDS